MIIFRYLTTWSLLQKPLHVLTSPVALWSSHSELCERVCPALKSSVLSAWIKRKSQLLGFELFFIWVEENEFSSVQSLSHVQLFVTLWTAAWQASLSIANSWSLLRLMSIETAMPSTHLILCHPLHLLPSIFCSIKVFSNESVLHIRGTKYWSFTFSISSSNEYSGLISFRMHWLDILAIQGTLKNLLQHHSSKASILQCSAFFILQFSHLYMTTGKTIALTRQTFVGKVMSLFFNMLSTFVIAFLPRRVF